MSRIRYRPIAGSMLQMTVDLQVMYIEYCVFIFWNHKKIFHNSNFIALCMWSLKQPVIWTWYWVRSLETKNRPFYCSWQLIQRNDVHIPVRAYSCRIKCYSFPTLRWKIININNGFGACVVYSNRCKCQVQPYRRLRKRGSKCVLK